MKSSVSFVLAIVLIFSLTSSALAAPAHLSVIPTFTIINIVPDTSITITTYNFPKNDKFDVLMGYMGTRGVNGIKVDTVLSGAGGTLTFTFNIPDALKGQKQIAVRLQSVTGSGYYAYNWFYNSAHGGSGGPVIIPNIPTFSITDVISDQTVTITTNNFPKADKFDVLMGYIGTRGVNGIKVDTVLSGTGGTLTFTFNIPDALKGQKQIAIRLQSVTGSGYYAYNWFYNSNTGGTGGIPGYTGFPTFFITSVVRNKKVTITTNNLPANNKFDVLMGPIGTRGINGYYVTTVDTGTGGIQTLEFTIPAQLKGAYQIAIRMQSSSGSGLYAYNWFYNNTTP